MSRQEFLTNVFWHRDEFLGAVGSRALGNILARRCTDGSIRIELHGTVVFIEHLTRSIEWDASYGSVTTTRVINACLRVLGTGYQIKKQGNEWIKVYDKEQ